MSIYKDVFFIFFIFLIYLKFLFLKEKIEMELAREAASRAHKEKAK